MKTQPTYTKSIILAILLIALHYNTIFAQSVGKVFSPGRRPTYQAETQAMQKYPRRKLPGIFGIKKEVLLAALFVVGAVLVSAVIKSSKSKQQIKQFDFLGKNRSLATNYANFVQKPKRFSRELLIQQDSPRFNDNGMITEFSQEIPSKWQIELRFGTMYYAINDSTKCSITQSKY